MLDNYKNESKFGDETKMYSIMGSARRPQTHSTVESVKAYSARHESRSRVKKATKSKKLHQNARPISTKGSLESLRSQGRKTPAFTSA